MKLVIPYKPQTRQQLFHHCIADEVLYGGAAGGGKSEALLHDALKNSLKYPNCKIIMFRRTFPDLERSLILRSRMIYPREVGKYNEAKKRWSFVNGSMIEFAYMDKEADVYNYQGAEYDFIYWDELTHFTETQYTYMLSRLRGTNPAIHRQVKAATNPGGVGHVWVKDRFIDPAGAEEVWKPEPSIDDPNPGTRCFIPAKLTDNAALMKADPGYMDRLNRLDEKTRKQLRDGDWDVFAGQYFEEFNRDLHVIDPFTIPDHWNRYRTLDYGLDMLAAYWVAIDTEGNGYIYKELYQSNLIISDAAKMINEYTDEKIRISYAPPDLWNRRQDTGKSASEVFGENGVHLTEANNDRVQGWYNVKEWLKPIQTLDEQTGETIKTARLKIFKTCYNLIRTLPQLQHDEKKPNDVANEPHELTHAPDAVRYFCSMRMPRTRALPDTTPKTPEQIRMDRIKEAEEKHLREMKKRNKGMRW